MLLCVPLLACQGQEVVAPDALLLSEIKAKVTESLAHLPNFTCAQTIERSVRRARVFHKLDTVRLEVAMIGGREVYGWPGANRISESELSSLVSGTIGTGDFGALERGIFSNGSTEYKFFGDADWNGRQTIRFDYAVPLPASGYRLRVQQNEAVVGFHGSFWADPDSLNILRIDVTAENIPSTLGLQATSKSLEYAAAKFGDTEFVLPASAQLDLTDVHGLQSRNRAMFHNCHQFLGTSKLSFTDKPDIATTGPTEAPKIEAIELPAKFNVELSLLTPIDSEGAAVGDEVQAKLEHDLKNGHTVLAPKGAVLTGRIMTLHRAGALFHLVIRPHAIDYENHHADLKDRENTISMALAIGPKLPRLAASYLPRNQSHAKNPILIAGEHWKLQRGDLLYLQSRLIESDKQ